MIKTENLLLHQELINSIMIDIKPKLIHIYFKRYTKEMIKAYFRKVREEFETNRPNFFDTPSSSVVTEQIESPREGEGNFGNFNKKPVNVKEKPKLI